MEIRKITITIKELCEDYINESETDIEKGIYAYSGKLCVRPAFQRSFVYDKKQENAVIDTALKGFPLNIMYWVDNGDGTYDCLDGQQRTISLCNFVDGISSFKAPWFNNNRPTYITNLKRIDPDKLKEFLNYKLEIYICKGTKHEQLEWFKTINIAGAELSVQELRNANYVSKWLTDAKRYFSRANNGGSLCPAERIGKEYSKGDANRQELLEQVISWKVNSNNDDSICSYMNEHINDENALDLWNYFNNVIDWVKNLFPGIYNKSMKNIEWGYLYNKYKETEFNIDNISETYYKLLEAKETGELTTSIPKIIEYCITRDNSLLKHRNFSDTQRQILYSKQKGICPDCGQHFLISEMHAHHIKSWKIGGLTELENGIMLCEECHTNRHLTE